MDRNENIGSFPGLLPGLGKSIATLELLAASAEKATKAMKEFRVAVYGAVPKPDNPIYKQMQAIADREGKVLKVIPYRGRMHNVFDKAWIVFDELHDLKWTYRCVVMRRGKKMVYHK